MTYYGQTPFQQEKVKGRILNIGCGDDPGKLKERYGAVNLDICAVDPGTGKVNLVDIIADARNLPPDLYGRFDTVVLGDILEHMHNDDILSSVKEAKKCLDEGGKIIITFPEDDRELIDQHPGLNINLEYIPGISIFHKNPLTLKKMILLLQSIEVEVDIIQLINYGFVENGWGLTCR